MKSFIAALLAIGLSSASIASAAVILDVEVNTKLNNDPVSTILQAGTYNVSFIDGLYDAWDPYNGVVEGCDENGANCDKGWLTNLDVTVNGKNKRYGNNGRFASADLALKTPGLFNSFSKKRPKFSCSSPTKTKKPQDKEYRLS